MRARFGFFLAPPRLSRTKVTEELKREKEERPEEREESQPFLPREVYTLQQSAAFPCYSFPFPQFGFTVKIHDVCTVHKGLERKNVAK